MTRNERRILARRALAHLHREGLTAVSIAARLKLPYRTVYNWIKSGRAPHPAALARLVRMATGWGFKPGRNA